MKISIFAVVMIAATSLPLNASATNMAELIEAISIETGKTRKDVEDTIESFLDLIKRHLAQGEQVSLVGFGTFSVRERAARTGRNPQTGEAILIPSSRVPVFKAAKILKDGLNKMEEPVPGAVTSP